MVALGTEQTIVFIILAGAGYWAVSMILNRLFPSRASQDESTEPEPTLRPHQQPHDRQSEQLCPEETCGAVNPPGAWHCSRCGRALHG